MRGVVVQHRPQHPGGEGPPDVVRHGRQQQHGRRHLVAADHARPGSAAAARAGTACRASSSAPPSASGPAGPPMPTASRVPTTPGRSRASACRTWSMLAPRADPGRQQRGRHLLAGGQRAGRGRGRATRDRPGRRPGWSARSRQVIAVGEAGDHGDQRRVRGELGPAAAPRRAAAAGRLARPPRAGRGPAPRWPRARSTTSATSTVPVGPDPVHRDHPGRRPVAQPGADLEQAVRRPAAARSRPAAVRRPGTRG